jgi:hypothetical protein
VTDFVAVSLIRFPSIPNKQVHRLPDRSHVINFNRGDITSLHPVACRALACGYLLHAIDLRYLVK